MRFSLAGFRPLSCAASSCSSFALRTHSTNSSTPMPRWRSTSPLIPRPIWYCPISPPGNFARATSIIRGSMHNPPSSSLGERGGRFVRSIRFMLLSSFLLLTLADTARKRFRKSPRPRLRSRNLSGHHILRIAHQRMKLPRRRVRQTPERHIQRVGRPEDPTPIRRRDSQPKPKRQHHCRPHRRNSGGTVTSARTPLVGDEYFRMSPVNPKVFSDLPDASFNHREIALRLGRNKD